MAKSSKDQVGGKLQSKILLFFHDNPGSVDTPRGISAWVNEDLSKVRAALEALAAKDYVRAHRTVSTIGYSCLLSAEKILVVTKNLNKK